MASRLCGNSSFHACLTMVSQHGRKEKRISLTHNAIITDLDDPSKHGITMAMTKDRQI